MPTPIRHADGLVLVDTGVGWGHTDLDAAYQPIRRPLDESRTAQKLRIEDVALVVNTHLHFDHCGSNRLFPEVPIFVQRTEVEVAHALPRFTILEWVDFDRADYRQLDGDAVILPGLRVLSTPGHTPGHQSVLVETSAGWKRTRRKEGARGAQV